MLDFGDVVVHVMSEDMRSYYDMERFYGAAEEVHLNCIAAPAACMMHAVCNLHTHIWVYVHTYSYMYSSKGMYVPSVRVQAGHAWR